MTEEEINELENRLSPIQKEIYKALEQHSEKALCTEAIIAKKIRDNAKLDGKNKAGLAMLDIEKVVELLETKNIHYGIHLNSANDILLKKGNETKYLDQDAKHRRQASEKSMALLTSGDLSSKKSKNNKQKSGRKEVRKLNINIFDFE